MALKESPSQVSALVQTTSSISLHEGRRGPNSLMNAEEEKIHYGLASLAAAASLINKASSKSYCKRKISAYDDDESKPRLLHLQQMRYEYFYSSMDEEIFKSNHDFINCLSQIGVNPTAPMKRSDLSRIRSVMSRHIGSPRRFSPAFIAAERDRLYQKRKSIRIHCQHLSSNTSHTNPLISPHLLCIGDEVIAYSRAHNVLSRGRIINEGPFLADGKGFLICFNNKVFRNEWCNDFDLRVIQRYAPMVDSATTSSSSSSSSSWATQAESNSDSSISSTSTTSAETSRATNVQDALSRYIAHAKSAVVSVAELKSKDYPAPLLDTVVRCVALILWMKKSVNIANATHQEVQMLTRQSLEYVTGDLGNVTAAEKESICLELQETIENMLMYANENMSAI